MTKRSRTAASLGALIGFGTAVAGIWQVYPPAALIAGGVWLFAASIARLARYA